MVCLHQAGPVSCPHSLLHAHCLRLSLGLQLYVDKVRLEEAQPGGFELVKGTVGVEQAWCADAPSVHG